MVDVFAQVNVPPVAAALGAVVFCRHCRSCRFTAVCCISYCIIICPSYIDRWVDVVPPDTMPGPDQL